MRSTAVIAEYLPVTTRQSQHQLGCAGLPLPLTSKVIHHYRGLKNCSKSRFFFYVPTTTEIFYVHLSLCKIRRKKRKKLESKEENEEENKKQESNWVFIFFYFWRSPLPVYVNVPTFISLFFFGVERLVCSMQIWTEGTWKLLQLILPWLGFFIFYCLNFCLDIINCNYIRVESAELQSCGGRLLTSFMSMQSFL